MERWKPRKPLKLLLTNYVGTRNTGTNIHMEEMIRQFQAILNDNNLKLSLMSNDKSLSTKYFRTVRQVTLPQVFPRFLFEKYPKHHNMVTYENSIFKSKFTNTLTTMITGTLNMATMENKINIGYNTETNHINDSTQRFVKKYYKHSLVICHNKPSKNMLNKLRIRTTNRTDTA